MSDHLGAKWRSFEGATLQSYPPHARRDMQIAFYAGAASAFDTLINGVSDSEEMTAEDEALARGLDEEIKAFVAGLGGPGDL